ncbi:MAG: LPS export ABC transporter permease LptF [Deltaproteobacteria bacterium]|nr:LPS export ABC transporter permease LptF [Deltaproteobacteria bacterium]
MKRILPRYIQKEILPPFVLSLGIFTLVLFMQNALELSNLIITKGVALSNIARIVLYTLPPTLWFTLPISFLTANLTALSRLSADNEVVAMNSLGIGMGSFVRPVMTLGILLFCLTFAVGALAVPWGRISLNQLVYRIFQESATAGIEPRVFNDSFTDLVIFADGVDREKDQLQHVLITDYRGALPETIYAQSGIIHSNPGKLTHTLTLHNGAVHQYDARKGRYRLIHFEEYQLSLVTDVAPVVYSMSLGEKTYHEMSLAELRQASRAGNPAERRDFQLHYYEKFALPFSCIIFGLVALPFGTRFRRSGKMIGFSWSLVIVFGYYLLLGAGRHFETTNMLSPMIAVWLPNVVFGGIGITALIRTSRRIPEDRGFLDETNGLWHTFLHTTRRILRKPSGK